jgi:hypothetical protein
MKNDEYCQKVEILKQILELEERILSATPSDNWVIGENSFVPSSLAIIPICAHIADL